MAEVQEPDRTVGGPPRRDRNAGGRPVESASGLFRANRTAPPVEPPAADVPEETEAEVAPDAETIDRRGSDPIIDATPASEPVTHAAEHAPQTAAVPTLPATTVAPGGVVAFPPERRDDPKITLSVDGDLRGRLQAAYRMARLRGGVDITWREWCLNALLAEAMRVEASYNGGEPLQGDGKKLRAGRPVGG